MGILRETWKVGGLVAAGAATVWIVSWLLQKHFLSAFDHAPGINLLFVPSGIRLIVIMIGGIWAAAGVCLGSFLLSGYEFHLLSNTQLVAVAACSGLGPYIALRGSLSALGIDSGLSGLAPRQLPFISLGVAVGSSLLHNLAFSATGLEPWSAFLNNSLAMTAGDFVGILLAVVIFFAFLRLYRGPAS